MVSGWRQRLGTDEGEEIAAVGAQRGQEWAPVASRIGRHLFRRAQMAAPFFAATFGDDFAPHRRSQTTACLPIGPPSWRR